MFNIEFWKRLSLIVCLAILIGCAKNDEDPSSRKSESGPTNERDPQTADKDLIASANRNAKPQYLPAVPELQEITWREVRRYNLALNNPPVVPPAKADFLRGDDIVLGVILGDEARAYPWILLANYHAVNDYLNGEPIIVNLCEACNGAAAFLATLPETVIDMRPRGLKNGTWYGIDFQTGSLWYPFIGEAFAGPLKGKKLTRIRIYFSSWRDWVREHPNTTVVVTSDEVRMRPHGRAGKMASEETFNPAFLKRITSSEPNPLRDLLPGHTLVFGLIPGEGTKPQAFTIESLGENKTLIQTKLDDTPILVMLQNQYQIGAYERLLYDDIELEFEIESENPLVMKDQRGNKWNMWGRTIEGRDHPSELALVDGYMAKWYEWVENFPDTQLISAE